MSADKHCVLTLENPMHVLPVEVWLAAPLSANAGQVLDYEHTRLLRPQLARKYESLSFATTGDEYSLSLSSSVLSVWS